jgi:hypothetical protein
VGIALTPAASAADAKRVAVDDDPLNHPSSPTPTGSRVTVKLHPVFSFDWGLRQSRASKEARMNQGA